MKLRKETEFLFKEVGAKRYVSRSRLPKPAALLPLTYSSNPLPDKEHFLYSTDPRALRIKEELADVCTREFPEDKLPSGFAGPTAVPGDFYSLRCASGVGMDPLPIPVYSNDKFVASLNLRSSIRPEDKPWFKEIVKLFFGHVAPGNLHIRKQASSGFPFFTNHLQYRKEATLKCLHHIDDFLNACTGDDADLERAYQEYHTLLIYAIQERQQPDKVMKDKNGTWTTKDRPVPTEEQARSGDYDAKLMADKKAYDDFGNVIPDHFAMRRRTVFGFSGIPNYVMTAVMACVREVYLNRFAYTYKTRDDEDKQQKISGYKFIVGSDVKSMDTTIPRWFFADLLSELHHYWDERLVELLRRMLAAPYVVPPPWRKTHEEYDPVFGNSPLKSTSFDSCVGLPSGIFINPDLGKLWMTFVYVILFRDSGALRSVSDIEPFLRGQNRDHALLNMSDDATMMTNSPFVRDRLAKAESPYAVLEPETPVIFLGSVFCESGGRKISVPNPVTYLVNMLAREDSIDKMDPVNYAEGVLARTQQYSRTPIFRDLHQITAEVVRKHTGVNPMLIAQAMAKRQKWTDVDAMVKANPHYLHYRVDPKDVSKEVLDEVVATIPASDFFDKIRHLFKVPTTSFEEVTNG